MLVKLETKEEVKAWVGEVQAAHSLTKEQAQFVVGTGKYSDGSKGYALEVRDHKGEPVAVTPISKMLFDMFRVDDVEIFKA